MVLTYHCTYHHHVSSPFLALQSAVFYMVGHASRALLYKFNNTTVTGGENLHNALRRPKGQALITVSNHIAALDDPLVVSAILEPQSLSETETVR